jgi:SpoVK/Ycf46/Vps4 family AAA+-type ATPase
MNREEMVDAAIHEGPINSREHLFSELKRIESVLLSEIKRTGEYINPEGDGYLGAGLSATGAASIFSTSFDRPTANYNINNKKRESQLEGEQPALHRLQKLFNLSAFDIDVILMCLLPELDSRFGKYYAYLHDDMTKKTPTVGIILRLLCADLEERLMARQAFYPDSPLIKNNLIYINDGTYQDGATPAAKSVRIDGRIADYLTGRNVIDYRLQSFTQLCQPKVSLRELVLPKDLKDSLMRFTRRNRELAPVYFFQGINGVGKRTVAEAVCHESGMSLLEINVKRLLSADIPVGQSIPLIFREGRLQNAAIFLEGSDLLVDSDSPEVFTGYESLLGELENYPHTCFLSSDNNRQIMYNLRNKLLFTIEFTLPNYSARKQLWQRHCQGEMPLADDVDIDALANKFRLTAGQIYDALYTARSLAIWRDPESGLITNSDLLFACRQQSRQALNALSHQVGSRYNWDDIILPKDQKEQLMEICNQVKHSHTVYNDWGFGHKLSRGKGLNILFSGPSGTGKTMAAEIMGNELGIDLYKIDLSTIVSKYIGETEKNLERIFREGTTANAIIFFDEADSLFGKRSEVRDSHDRYANIEISYLLQKMEDYDGVIILATNLRKNIDEAFARRMHFTIEFPMPGEADRYRIWESIFPEKAPLGQDLDLRFLARQFTITGGNIRNIVLASAFLAAQDGGLITMEKIIRATKREYQKTGKLCTENDFAHYFDLVKS